MPVADRRARHRGQIAARPKALLHDHLDGGLRPQTIVDLAAEIGHELPASDAERARPLVRRVGATPGRWSATSRRSTTRSR